ncbi:hypothetical protein GOBAR_DD06954 [Gossypium barbadense]|nr:hypothetical protein GOBAR_DD06954 [Gossypium barbadense]
MSSHGVRTRGMRDHGELGLNTQIDSSALRGRSSEPATEPELMIDLAENTRTMEEDNLEPADDAVSQGMLRVALLQERVFEALVEKTKIVEEVKRLECESRDRVRILAKRDAGPTVQAS